MKFVNIAGIFLFSFFLLLQNVFGADLPDSRKSAPSNQALEQKSAGDDAMKPDGTRALLSEGFESGSLPSNWTTYDANRDQVLWGVSDAQPAHTGTYFAGSFVNYLDGNDDWLISPAMDVTSGNKTFAFYAQAAGFGSQTFDVKLSTAGRNITHFTVTLESNVSAGFFSWTTKSYDLTSYVGQTVYIAIIHTSPAASAGSAGALKIDDVSGPNLNEKAIATYPVPIENSENVLATTQLRWVSGTTVVEERLYFGTNPEIESNPLYEKVSSPWTPPATLEYGTTYYWRLDTDDEGEVNWQIGDAWSFTTQDNPHYGGGGGSSGGYYFANSTTNAGGAPSQPVFNWIDISGTGTSVLGELSDDAVIGAKPIGFTFNYFGTNYTQFWIADNGWIAFQSQTLTTEENAINTYMPRTRVPNNFIALFWEDMNSDETIVSGTDVLYGNSGGDLVITFEKYPIYGADADGWITAQIILKQNGNIKLQYKEHGSSIDLNGATAGIESSGGTSGIEYRYNSFGGPLFSSPLAVEFGTNDQALPVDLTDFSIRADHEKSILSWFTHSEIENAGFEIYRSDSEHGQYRRVASYLYNSELQGAGYSSSSRFYEFEDTDVKNGKLYWYKISDVDYNGRRNFHGPLSIVPNRSGVNMRNTGVIPQSFALENNFPNPFNPTTTLRFDIPVNENGLVFTRLVIYNTLGQRVKLLVEENLPAGSYQIDWDGKDNSGKQVSSGIYIYGIESREHKAFKKMTLLK